MASTIGIVAKYGQKAAGTYREIIDETATNLATSSTNVVVVIQSEQGPVMKPIYCEDIDTLHAIFGMRNAKLESKGNFGILMAEHVLEAGPVWILNLKNINANTETVDVIKLACNNADNEAFAKETINTVFDTTKFWNVDPMYGTHGEDAMLSFAAIANGAVTIVVTKYEDTDKNYNYTVKETKAYNETFLGEGLDDDAFVSDYLIQVDIFKTNLSTANITTVGAIKNGRINLSKLDELRKDANAKHFKTYVGSVGNVIDLSGNKLSIVAQINADYLRSGIWCALNADDVATNGIDLLGISSIEFAGDSGESTVCKQIKRLGETVTPSLTDAEVMVPVTATNTAYYQNNAPSVGDVIATDKAYARVSSVQYVGDNYVLSADTKAKLGTADAPIQANGKPFSKQDGIFVYPATAPAAKAGQQVEVQDNKVLNFYEELTQTLADWTIDLDGITTGDNSVLTIAISSDSAGTVQVATNAFSQYGSNLTSIATALTSLLNTAITDAVFECTVVDTAINIAVTSVNAGVANVQLIAATVTDEHDTAVSIEVPEIEDTASNVMTLKSEQITLSGDDTAGYKVTTVTGGEVNVDMTALQQAFGDATKMFLVTFDRPLDFIPTSVNDDPTEVVNIVGNDVIIERTVLHKLEAWYKQVSFATMHVATGIKSLESHYVNGTVARQESILDMLNSNGIMNAFADKTVFRCRYMVDSFKTYIAPNQKQQYAKLAAKAVRFLAFIPAPFFYELRTSKNPSFYDLLGNFKMSYVKLGYNPDVPSTNSFGYTTDTDGAKYLVPIMNIVHNDGFADKVVPATGLLAKYFYIKHLGAHKVYDIVAGQDWPLSASGVVGPEFVAEEGERAAMEQMGTNVLQNIDGVLQVRSNRTAFQNVMSALNYPETIEKVFYVQDYVEPVLDGKLFKYNNADSRLQVKLTADEACDQMVADGVIASYRNICDLSNNPTDVREAGIILLDTELYNEYGIRIAVHRVTIKNADK